MSRRPFVEPSDDEEDFSEQDWETKLYVCLGSIKAGNSSIKLKNQVFSLLDLLVGHGTINGNQKKKIVRDYIDQ